MVNISNYFFVQQKITQVYFQEDFGLWDQREVFFQVKYGFWEFRDVIVLSKIIESLKDYGCWKYENRVVATDGRQNDTTRVNITVININDWDPR